MRGFVFLFGVGVGVGVVDDDADAVEEDAFGVVPVLAVVVAEEEDASGPFAAVDALEADLGSDPDPGPDDCDVPVLLLPGVDVATGVFANEGSIF